MSTSKKVSLSPDQPKTCEKVRCCGYALRKRSSLGVLFVVGGDLQFLVSIKLPQRILSEGHYEEP